MGQNRRARYMITKGFEESHPQRAMTPAEKIRTLLEEAENVEDVLSMHSFLFSPVANVEDVEDKLSDCFFQMFSYVPFWRVIGLRSA